MIKTIFRLFGRTQPEPKPFIALSMSADERSRLITTLIDQEMQIDTEIAAITVRMKESFDKEEAARHDRREMQSERNRLHAKRDQVQGFIKLARDHLGDSDVA